MTTHEHTLEGEPASGASAQHVGPKPLQAVHRRLFEMAYNASAGLIARLGGADMAPMMMFVQSSPSRAAVGVGAARKGMLSLPVIVASAGPFFRDQETKAALARMIQAVLADRGAALIGEMAASSTPAERATAAMFDVGVDAVIVVCEAWASVATMLPSGEVVRDPSVARQEVLTMMLHQPEGATAVKFPILRTETGGVVSRSLGPLEEGLQVVAEAEGRMVPRPTAH